MQALLMEEDVDLVAQHFLGTVLSLSPTGPVKSRRVHPDKDAFI